MDGSQEVNWIAHGYAWLFSTQHYNDFVFKAHVMARHQWQTNTWDAGNALVRRVDDVTCFGNPRPLSSSWCVLNPSQCGPEYDNRNECSNLAGLLTAFNRAAGIPRARFSRIRYTLRCHSAEIWTSQNWYVARGYNVNESSQSGGCPSRNYTGGSVALRSTSGWYSGSHIQGVYAADEKLATE